ncbi:ATP-binding protein [Flindersiella endophytica]
MKLHRLRMHDFRGVSERVVEFGDTGVTVVVGDNETGKSSLLEAFTLLLEFPDDSKHIRIRAVQPAGRDVSTEVEAAFSLGAREIVYRKRWFRQRLTELQVTSATGAETFIGREAHDQAGRLFRAEVDETLWSALVVGQEDSLAMPAPGAVTAVLTALDGQAGGAVDHGESAPIVEAVEKEFLRYFTPGGRPTGTYSEALRRKDEARELVDAANAAVAQVEHDVSRAESLVLERGRLTALAKDQAKVVAALQQRRRAADELLTRVERLRHEHTLATERLTAARGELQRREALSADLARREQGVVEATEAAKVAAETLRTAEAELTGCAEALAKARDKHAAARERVAGLDARMSRLRDEADLAELTQRLAAVQSAQQEERKATAILAGNRVDPDVADLAERLHRDVLTARAALSAGAPRLRVRRLGESSVLVDSTPRTDDDFEVIAERPTELAVDGVLSVTVHPGEGIGRLTAALEEAERSEASLLDELGQPDIAAVRQAARDRQVAERARLVAEETLTRRLDGTTVEELQQREAVLTARIAAAGGPVTPSEPAPDGGRKSRTKKKTAAARRAKREEPADDQDAFLFDVDVPARPPTLAAGAEEADPEDLMTLDAVRDALAEARSAENASATKLTEVEHAEALARKGYEGASSGMAAARVRSEQETEHRDDLASALASAREARPDEALAEAVEIAEQHAGQIGEDLAAATEEVAESGAGEIHQELEDATLVRDRLAGQIESLQGELHRLEGALDQAGKQGLATTLEKAKADFAHAERQADLLDRRAAAARLLRETLAKHRAEARRRYSAPLRERIQNLGRALHGPTFDVQLGDDLEVVTRIVDGVALPVESLSVGAREQLATLVRLAIAGLTAADGTGVPVVLDDALGWSDPGRLRAMGGLLDRAGATGQVIVLTSMPDRYAHIPRATTVRL